MFCFIKAQKDPLPISSYKNVIYKIFCNNYATHVEQTGRVFLTRISEDRNHIKKNTTTNSPIIIWIDFKWDEVETLDVDKKL